jgi:hypothetical protein
LNLRGVISLSLLFHGGVELTHVGGYARAPAKSRGSGVYDRDELATYRVPEDPASPTSMGGYIVAYVAFYERGFSVPSH